MEQTRVVAGMKMRISAPVQPLPPDRAAAIASAVARIPEIVEAHLPQCLVEGDSEPRQVLAIGVARGARFADAVAAVGAGLSGIFPSGQLIDVLPFPQFAVPGALRAAQCQIYPMQTKKAWWKIW